MRNNNLIYIGSTAYAKETLLIDLDLLDTVQKLALKEGHSVSEIINTLLKRGIENDE